eukprot:999679_1
MSFGSTILSLITGALLLFGAVTWWKETKQVDAIEPKTSAYMSKTSRWMIHNYMSNTDHSWCNAAQIAAHCALDLDSSCVWDDHYSDCLCDDLSYMEYCFGLVSGEKGQ